MATHLFKFRVAVVAVASCWLFASSEPFAAEFRLTDQNGDGLGNAVITLDTAVSATSEAGTVVTVEQRGQQFRPRVIAIKPGTSVRFPNRDLTQHHVYSFSEPKSFEIELYGGDEPGPVMFDHTGIVAIGCNIHDWMLGYLYISPDPNFGVTDTDGKLKLSVDLSTVNKITVWHPGLKGSVPLSFSGTELFQSSTQIIDLTVDIPNGDPLAFDPDPLQALFEDLSQ